MEHEEAGGGGHDSSERWLVSYADFITLLFALFVLMYAMSMQSSDHVNRAWSAMATGLGARPHKGGMRPELGETARGGSAMSETAKRSLTDLRTDMTIALRQYQDSGVTTLMDPRGLVVSLAAARFFASGDAEIAPTQLPVLAAVASQLNGRPNAMEVDGFTDPVPIHDGRFRDNWELSAARAATVLRYLIAHTWLPSDHLTLAGYGPNHPIAENATEQGRSLNRRVEIVVRPLEIQ
jgi:chemotaxis protein MotB